MNKKIILIILTAITFIGIAFLPLAARNNESSFVDMLGVGLDNLFEHPFGIALFAAVALAVIAFICALSENFGGCQLCSWLGASAVILAVVLLADLIHIEVGDVIELLGSGMWVGCVGFIVCACVAGSSPAAKNNSYNSTSSTNSSNGGSFL